MTPNKLDELERLAKAATPGPWEIRETHHAGTCVCSAPPGVKWHDVLSYGSDEDAAYVAAISPDVVLGLLAEHKKLVAFLRELSTRADGYIVSTYVCGKAHELLTDPGEQG